MKGKKNLKIILGRFFSFSKNFVISNRKNVVKMSKNKILPMTEQNPQVEIQVENEEKANDTVRKKLPKLAINIIFTTIFILSILSQAFHESKYQSHRENPDANIADPGYPNSYISGTTVGVGGLISGPPGSEDAPKTEYNTGSSGTTFGNHQFLRFYNDETYGSRNFLDAENFCQEKGLSLPVLHLDYQHHFALSEKLNEFLYDKGIYQTWLGAIAQWT